MRDIVVILPGITGSVPQENGKEVWVVSGHPTTRDIDGNSNSSI
ncbi:hypothetical protein [Nostoc sp. C110]